MRAMEPYFSAAEITDAEISRIAAQVRDNRSPMNLNSEQEYVLRSLCERHGVDFETLVRALNAPDDESADRIMQGTNWSALTAVMDGYFNGAKHGV
jgi:hypothetical protein